jgi:hypothetical protein
MIRVSFAQDSALGIRTDTLTALSEHFPNYPQYATENAEKFI